MRRRALVLVALLFLGYLAASGKDEPPIEELWAEPRNIAALDLFHGRGGRELLPSSDVVFRFESEDKSGHSGGYDVVDPRGREWDVKIGEEAQSEVVVSRILWALGYRQPVTYYVPRWRMKGGPTDSPPPGRFRLESDHDTEGEWAWRKNPFVGTKPLNGLIVVNLLLNNWDLAASQNRIYQVPRKAPHRLTWYVVQDVGGSLGRSRAILGTRNDLEGFEREGFIKAVSGGRVTFDFHGRHRGLRNQLTPEDVVWACRLLDRLSHRQLDDAFRAAGYSEDARRRYLRKIEEKIHQGLALER